MLAADELSVAIGGRRGRAIDRLTALWHPFADMAAVSGAELALVRGEGVFVWDDQGRRYLDGASSLWYANVGTAARR